MKRFFYLLSAILPAILLTNCSRDIGEFEIFLHQKEILYENIMVEKGMDVFEYYAKNDPSEKQIEVDISELLRNDSLINEVTYWYKKRDDVEDVFLKRRIEIWKNMIEFAKINYDENILHLSNSIENGLNLVQTGDTTVSIDDLNIKMRELINNRNSLAQKLGYKNFADFMFVMRGFDSEWFDNFAATVLKFTEEPYNNLVDEYKETNGVSKFTFQNAKMLGYNYMVKSDFSLPEDKTNLEVMKSTMKDLGFDYDTLPIEWYEQQLPPGIGGQGLALNVPDDFRAVLNLNMSISVWMHEMGHGIHWMHMRQKSPILEGYEWVASAGSSAYAEGMAEVWGKMVFNEEWQNKYTRFGDKDRRESREIMNKYYPVYIRFYLFMSMLENEVYKNPQKTKLELSNELVKKIFLAEEELTATSPLASLVYVTYPLYSYNYILADVIAWQVHKKLENEFGSDYMLKTETGDYLKKMAYAEGEFFPFEERLERLTGSKLDLVNYLESFKN